MRDTNIEHEGECLDCQAYEKIIGQLRRDKDSLSDTIKQLQEENQRLKGLLREWIDQFGYPGKSLTNDTLNAIKQNP